MIPFAPKANAESSDGGTLPPQPCLRLTEALVRLPVVHGNRAWRESNVPFTSWVNANSIRLTSMVR